MKRPTIEYLLLVLILLLGAYFRFTGLDWDGSYHLHPDERFLTDTTSLLKPAPDPLTYLRTSQSPMNPYNVGKGFYVYGNFPMTVTRFTAEWVNAICALFPVQPGTAAPPDVTGLTAFGCRYNFAAYDGVHLLGRFLSGLLDLATILFTFLIGRRLYDGRVGLLGALLYALAVLPIQQAHFYTMDSWAAALATITLYAAVRASNDFGGEFQNPKSKIQNRWWILFGFGLGLTVASRVNLAPLALMAGVAAAIGLARRLQGREGLERPVMVVVIQQAMGAVLVAAGVSIVTFRLAQPYAFADSQIARQAAQGSEPGFLTIALQSVVGLNPQWLSNLAEIQRLQSPDASFPPALQWTDRAPILFPLTNIVLYGMGVTAGIAAFAGLAWALWRILRGRPDWTAHALPVAWSALYFLFMGTRWVKSMRYFLPIYPTLLLLAAWAVFKIISHKFPQFPGDSRNSGNSQRQDILARSRGVLRVSAVSSLTVLVVAPSLLWANAFVQTYRQPVTRVAASGWMLDNIRSGATLLYEAGGRPQELQLPLKGYTFEPNGPPVFLTFRLPPAADDPAAPLRVTAVRFNFLSDPDNDADTERLQVSLDAAFGRPEVLTEVEATFDLRQERQEVVVDLPDVELLPNTTHTVLAAAGAGGRFVAGTSVILNEHWDDPLPVRYEGKDPFAAYVVGVEDPVLDVHGQIPITNPDSEEKRLAFLRWLDSADVVVLSSQRAVWSTPRLALTYPMTTRYYQALFSGELGFALAGQFHANYHVGPLYISDTGGRLRWGGPPEVGWPPPGDLAAEEAFSVYDHPPVWIFVKTDAYHPDKVRQVLESVDLNQVVFMNPGQATKAPSGLQLSPEDLAIQRANGSFRSVFEVDGLLSRRPAAGAVVWWAAVIVLGWLTFPISFVVFRGLSDRGYALSRILGLLWVSYFGWLTASLKVGGRPLLPFTRGTLLLGLGLMALLSLVILFRQRRAIMAFIREQRSILLVMELVGLGLYLLFILIRLGNPDAWDVIWGGEKPMDLSYFTAVLKSTSFPPYDPWFAGGYINYYYYGFVYVGALTKLLGVAPAVAYNLIVPMLFSFTGLGAFAIAYNLVASGKGQVAGGRGAEEQRSRGAEEQVAGGNPKSKIQNPKSAAVAAGLVALALCVLLGNLAEVGVMLGAWQRASDSPIHTGIGVVDTLWRTIDGGLDVTLGDKPVPMYPGDWFWTATRAINVNPGETAPITEFPFFTFLYGDLHAHMIALPLTLLALGWAVAHALKDEQEIHPSSFILLHFLMGGLAIGALRATNTWDWPTYLLIGVLAVFYAAVRKQHSVGADYWSLITGMGAAVLQAAALVILSVLTFWPFAQNYGVGYTSFALWPGSYTYLKNYLAIYGLFLFFVLTHLAREFRAWSATWTQEGLARWRPVSRLVLVTLFLYVVVLLALLIKDYWIGPVVLTLALAAGLLSLRPGLPPARRIVLLLMAMSLALTLMVEIIVLEGDIGRMNTVFKFYLQVWVLLSVTCGAAAVWDWPAVTHQWGPTGRRIWQTILIALLLMAVLYPVLATKAKWDVRMSKETPHTLDGMAYMQYVQYEDHGQTIPLRYDYEAIQWMQRNIEGSPLIVEAFSDNPYRSIATRVVMYTGLPTIVGWDWHQRQQRAVVPGSLVQNRIQAVNGLYNTIDAQQALSILNQYGVQYVYVGPLERAYYSPDGIAKFDLMAAAGQLREVYRNEGVTIYEVIRSSSGN